MLNMSDIMETITMIQEENLDIRTITMGISLIDCADSDIEKSCEKVYNKILRLAKDLVKTGEFIEKKYGAVRDSHRKQENLRDTDFHAGRRFRRRPCKIRKNPGQSCPRGRRKLHRRFFRSGTERFQRRRQRAD